MPRNEKEILVWEYEGGATKPEARRDGDIRPWCRTVPGRLPFRKPGVGIGAHWRFEPRCDCRWSPRRHAHRIPGTRLGIVDAFGFARGAGRPRAESERPLTS